MHFLTSSFPQSALLFLLAGLLSACPVDETCQETVCGGNQECIVTDDNTPQCVDLDPQVVDVDVDVDVDAGVVAIDLPVLMLEWVMTPVPYNEAHLTWEVSGAENCRLDFGDYFSGSVEKSYSIVFEAIAAGTHEAVLTCDNAGGVSTAKAEVEIIGEPSVDVQFSATNLAVGDVLVVNLQAEFVSSCEVNVQGVVTRFLPDEGLNYWGESLGSLDVSVEQVVDETTTVLIYCSGLISFNAQQEVRVGGILSFAADTPVVQGPQSITFRWETMSDGCVLSDGNFSYEGLSSTGEFAVSLANTSTFTLTCQVGETEVAQRTDVFVIDGVSFDVDGPLPYEGQSEFTIGIGFMGEAPADAVCGIEFPDGVFVPLADYVDTLPTTQVGVHRLRCGMGSENVEDYLLLASIAVYDAVTILQFDLVMEETEVFMVDMDCQNPGLSWKTFGATSCTLQGADTTLDGEVLIVDVVNGTAEEVVLTCFGAEGQQTSQSHRIWMQPATTSAQWDSLRLYQPTITTEPLVFPTEETGLQELPASIVGTCGHVAFDPARPWVAPANLRTAHFLVLTGGSLIEFPALENGRIMHEADTSSVTIRTPKATHLLVVGGNELNDGTTTEYTITAPLLGTLSFVFFNASSLDFEALPASVALFNGFYQDETTALIRVPENIEIGTLFIFVNDLVTDLTIDKDVKDAIVIGGGGQLETISMPNLTSPATLNISYTSVQTISLPALEEAGEFAIGSASDLTRLEVPLLRAVQDFSLKSIRSFPCDDIEALIAQLDTPPLALDAPIDANNCLLP